VDRRNPFLIRKQQAAPKRAGSPLARLLLIALAVTYLSLPALHSLHVWLDDDDHDSQALAINTPNSSGARQDGREPAKHHHHDDSHCDICQLLLKCQSQARFDAQPILPSLEHVGFVERFTPSILRSVPAFDECLARAPPQA
jgi:hypothetical protein